MFHPPKADVPFANIKNFWTEEIKEKQKHLLQNIQPSSIGGFSTLGLYGLLHSFPQFHWGLFTLSTIGG
jgi:hypothetical protein